MTNASPPVLTRFAPSPTGHLHIGGARTALFCWAFSKGRGGSFILRIEDTDQARSSEESARGIMQDMAWLGIDWDEGPKFKGDDGRSLGGDPRGVGPFFQAQRIALYNQHLDRLIASGKAYQAFEKPEELDAKRKSVIAAGKQYRYDRAPALAVPIAERAARAKAGEPHVVRLLAPSTPIVVHDEILGEVVAPAGELEDFVLRKADGFPTYHFAVVIDDETMGVTHVVRAQEHLANTPKHVALQEALGFKSPKYAHLPLIFNESGGKMSKREKDKAAREACKAAGIKEPPVPGIDPAEFAVWLGDSKSQLETSQLEALAAKLKMTLPEINVDDFRKAGYLPEVVCNYIALLGWSPGEDVEKFDTKFLRERFDLGRIGKTNARFDRKKLLAFSNDAFAAMNDADFRARWREWCERYEPEIVNRLSPERFAIIAAAVRPRSKTLRDAAEASRFALIANDAVEFDAKSVEKNLTKDGEGLAVLRELRTALSGVKNWDAPTLHTLVESFAAQKGLGMGKVAQPLRVALTGGTVSPPIDATLAVLGKDGALARIDRCVAMFGKA